MQTDASFAADAKTTIEANNSNILKYRIVAFVYSLLKQRAKLSIVIAFPLLRS